MTNKLLIANLFRISRKDGLDEFLSIGADRRLAAVGIGVYYQCDWESANRPNATDPHLAGAIVDANGAPRKLIFHYADSEEFAAMVTDGRGRPMAESLVYFSGVTREMRSRLFEPAAADQRPHSFCCCEKIKIIYDCRDRKRPRELWCGLVCDQDPAPQLNRTEARRLNLAVKDGFVVILPRDRPRSVQARVGTDIVAGLATPFTVAADMAVDVGVGTVAVPLLFIMGVTGTLPRC